MLPFYHAQECAYSDGRTMDDKTCKAVSESNVFKYRLMCVQDCTNKWTCQVRLFVWRMGNSTGGSILSRLSASCPSTPSYHPRRLHSPPNDTHSMIITHTHSISNKPTGAQLRQVQVRQRPRLRPRHHICRHWPEVRLHTGQQAL